ncbi:poly(glycerol-phosphate) alpha-glucosyltransferase [Weissella beninensis]|uniref:Glycosyltransferase n=1 Tax=Periweissella beninensis TaxID=504936 RepID=A0ABT0VHM9_9LACO|nr:poly(glycerol-phosphate) alpha-glucosyltransferase [Periweissella beninensis]MCM2437346.1 glycosyltransferase [Periweissella beninensis]
MHYFINYSLVDINSSIEHAALMRLKLFKSNNLAAKYITLNWDYLNPLRVKNQDLTDADVVNMYDFFANTAQFKQTPRHHLADLPLPNAWTWDNSDANQATIKEGDRVRAKVHYIPGLVETTGKIDYYDTFGKHYRTEYWDPRGFLISAELYSAQGNVLEQVLYDVNTEQPVLTRFFHVVDNQVVLYRLQLNHAGQTYTFNHENALISFFLNVYTQADDAAVLYVDRPNLAQPVLEMRQTVQKVLMVPTLHTSDPDDQVTANLNNEYYYSIYEHLRDFDAVLVATEHQAQDLRRWLGGSADDLTSTKTPIYAVSRAITHPTAPTEPKTAGKIIYAGLLNDYEALKDIVVAYSKAKKEFPHLSLVMAGYGEAYEQLKNDVAKQNIADISFPGYLQTPALAQELKTAALFLTTQKGDVQPLTLLQALSFSTPVISYAFNYGPRDIDPDQQAIVTVSPRKRSLLVKQVVHFFATSDHQAQQQAAATIAANYSPTKVLAQYQATGLLG